VVGFNGSREHGLEELLRRRPGRRPSQHRRKNHTGLFLRRESQLHEALELVRELETLFPQNIIFAIQEGDMLRAAHRNQEAMIAYRRVWEAGRAGHFPVGGYELATVNIGDLQRSMRDDAGALASYNLMEETSQAAPELRQRAFLNAGEIYDLQQKRKLAINKYEAVVAMDASFPMGSAGPEVLKGRILRNARTANGNFDEPPKKHAVCGLTPPRRARRGIIGGRREPEAIPASTAGLVL